MVFLCIYSAHKPSQQPNTLSDVEGGGMSEVRGKWQEIGKYPITNGLRLDY